MIKKRKKPESDLRKYHTVFLEIGLVIVLLIFIGAVKVQFTAGETDQDLTEEQEVVEMEEIERTEQEEEPPPPPRPQVPVEVPNDEIIEDQDIVLDADLDSDQPLDMPPPPSDDEEEDEEDFFRVVEDMPEIVGGQEALYDCIEYPERARRAGIEGTVSVEFIVNTNGQVEEPTILRGVEGLNDEAIRCIRAMDYTPGQQRGEPVRVKFVQPVTFELQ